MCATYEYLDVWFKPVHVTTKLKTYRKNHISLKELEKHPLHTV